MSKQLASVGVARVRVTSASFRVRTAAAMTAAAAAATRLAWLVSRGRGGHVNRGGASLFTRPRREDDTRRRDHVKPATHYGALVSSLAD